jgi:hypothetical protein
VACIWHVYVLAEWSVGMGEVLSAGLNWPSELSVECCAFVVSRGFSVSITGSLLIDGAV